MAQKEAKARIKINDLLEEAGWRFFDIVAVKEKQIKDRVAAVGRKSDSPVIESPAKHNVEETAGRTVTHPTINKESVLFAEEYPTVNPT